MDEFDQIDLFEDTEFAPQIKVGFDPVKATEYMQRYWGNYHEQYGYETYTREMFLEDALYGIGAAIDPVRFKWADGYHRFKKWLQCRWFKHNLQGRQL